MVFIIRSFIHHSPGLSVKIDICKLYTIVNEFCTLNKIMIKEIYFDVSVLLSHVWN